MRFQCRVEQLLLTPRKTLTNEQQLNGCDKPFLRALCHFFTGPSAEPRQKKTHQDDGVPDTLLAMMVAEGDAEVSSRESYICE